jgi:hypothetical protein
MLVISIVIRVPQPLLEKHNKSRAVFRVWHACSFGHVRCLYAVAPYFVKQIWWLVFGVSVVFFVTHFSFCVYRAVKIEESTDVKPVIKEVSVRKFRL